MCYDPETHEEEFMKTPWLAAPLLIVFAAPLFAADAPKAPAADAPAKADAADADRAPYAYGFDLGMKLADLGFSDAETKQILTGLGDGMRGQKAPFEVDKYQEQIRALIEGHLAQKTEKEKAAGKAFGEKFAKEAGVKPLTGGGWYKIIKKGDGAQATADDTVKVNYEGKLIDGSVFDSSYKRGEPATFPLKGVIPCWTNGVAKLKVHGKAKLVCPSDAAYGDRGHPPVIPGGATLVFEVELLDIVKPDAMPAASSGGK
jgi:FKBP-type peptidyl-prolyl cis-trans isomerase FkpA